MRNGYTINRICPACKRAVCVCSPSLIAAPALGVAMLMAVGIVVGCIIGYVIGRVSP